jgi:hypothetical protein
MGRGPKGRLPRDQVRVLQVEVNEESKQKLQSVQGLINATNPPGGPLNQSDVFRLAINLLYKRLSRHRTGLRQMISRLGTDEELDKRQAGTNGNGNAKPEPEPLAGRIGQSSDDDVCDFDEIDRWKEEDAKEKEKAAKH